MYKTTSINPSAVAVATTALAGMALFVMLVCLAVVVLRIIARWRIFEKAGEKGWKALIPFYSDYIFYKIVDMTPFFWALLASSVVLGVISTIAGATTTAVTNNYGFSFSYTSANPVVTMLSGLIGIFGIVVNIFVAIRLAKVFKKGGGYIAGLILVPDIFLMILGFGKAKYDKKALK